MLPAEAALTIESFKRQLKLITKDQAMHAVFADAFDMLINLCTKDITAENFETEIGLMQLQLNVWRDQDKIRTSPLRWLIYALNQAICNTAKVLVAKSRTARGLGMSGQAEVKQEEQDPAGVCQIVPGAPINLRTALAAVMPDESNQMVTEVKEEPVDDDDEGYIYDPEQCAIPEEELVGMPKLEDEEQEEDMASSQYSDAPKLEEEDDFSVDEEETNLPQSSGYSIRSQNGYHQPGSWSRFDGAPRTGAPPPQIMLTCPLCTISGPKKRIVPRTLSNMRKHLKDFHQKTVLSAKLHVACVCGYETQNLNFVFNHTKMCPNASFELLRNANAEKVSGGKLNRYHKVTTVSVEEGLPDEFGVQRLSAMYICPFCKVICKRRLRSFETHLKDFHRRSPKQAGLYFECTCKFVTRIVNETVTHKQQCADSFFRMCHSS